MALFIGVGVGRRASNRSMSPYRELNPLLNSVIIFCVSLILVWLMVLAVISNRSNTSAADTNINLTPDMTSVAVYADGQSSSYHSMNPLVNQDGTVSSIVSDIRVVSTGSYGYNLMIQTGQGANMVGQGNSSNVLTPINGSIENPAPFTTGDCNSWGFATPAVGGNYSAAFDKSYSTSNSIPIARANSRYAAVPTAATLIHEGSSNDETRPYYFAACVNSSVQSDTYNATVVWTAYSLDSPIIGGRTIVDLDPNMIPVRWNYNACTYGNGTGNVMASDPNTNVTATNPVATGAACWVKADPSIYGTGTNDDWYNYTTDATMTTDSYNQPYYTNRKMANAVTFTDATKLAQYQSSPIGTPILESDIGAYWTYLPRYEYKVERFNYDSTNYPHAFDVRLTNNGMAHKSVKDIDTSLDPVATPQWLTPAGFTRKNSDGTLAELNGLWFGKFETGGSTSNPSIKPYQVTINQQNLSAMFNASLRFGNMGIAGSQVSFTGGNQHNFSNLSKTNSHLAKNSEWGTLVYFTNSMYGVCSNMNCTSNDTPMTSMGTAADGQLAKMQRVRNNAYVSSNSHRAGCGPNVITPTDDAVTTSCQLYNTQLGVLASTNHNIYGIYDSAGGLMEYTTGNYVTGGGSAINTYAPTAGGSGFSSLAAMFNQDASAYYPYFDVYPNPPVSAVTDITSGKYGLGSTSPDNSYWDVYVGKLGLGQGIFEAAGWSQAGVNSVWTNTPWFARSGCADCNVLSGVETISMGYNTPGYPTFTGGMAFYNIGFRTIVTVSSR